MEFRQKIPPREFEVGFDRKGTIRDCGSVYLAADEQLTFVTEAGAEYDVTRKNWGFYATPSLNGRLANFNLRAVLVKNRMDRFFVFLVEAGKEPEFQAYAEGEPLKIVAWLDSTDALKRIEEKLDAKT